MSNNAELNDFEAGMSVNASIDGEKYVGEIVRIFKNGKIDVLFGDGDKMRFTVNDLEIRRPGRRSLIDTLSDDERDEQVSALLSALVSCDDQAQKKNIRAALRRLGHTGGLRSNEE